MVELVDTRVLDARAVRREGSSPSGSKIKIFSHKTHFLLAFTSVLCYYIDVKGKGNTKPKPKEPMMNDKEFVKMMLKGLVIIFTGLVSPFVTMFTCAAFGVGLTASVILVFVTMGLSMIPFICADWI